MPLNLESKTSKVTIRDVRITTWKRLRTYAIQQGLTMAQLLDRLAKRLNQIEIEKPLLPTKGGSDR